MLLRRELWNGNRERLRDVLSLDPERSIVTWAWRMHDTYDDEYEAHLHGAPVAQRWVVLENRRQVIWFLRELPHVVPPEPARSRADAPCTSGLASGLRRR